MRSAVYLLLAVLVCAAASSAADPFIKVSQNGQGSWSFEKDGRRFFSMGICHIAGKLEGRGGGKIYDGIQIRGGVDRWATAAVQRMTQGGFNTAGAWCDESIYAKPIPKTRLVWLGMEVDGIKQRLMNVFSPGYAAAVEKLCVEQVAPHKDDPWLIGWFLDNELPWFGEFGWMDDKQKSLLELALALPAADPNRQEALRFLQEHYGDFARFAAEWETSATSWQLTEVPRAKSKRADIAKMAWAGRVAERFYSVCAAAVRKQDPNHLLLGSRYAGSVPGPVLAACARHCDVVSMNRYQKDGQADLGWWDRLYAIVQKPILVSEFSYRAMENRSGNRNGKGADVTVATQAERAERYGKFVGTLMARPYLVGMHWFEWADQPENGRALDGEDSNYGVVDWQDREYTELLAAAKATHAAIPSPGARAGSLPAAADRDGAQWSAPAFAQLPDGKLAAPVDLIGAGDAMLTTDQATGARASVLREGAQWKIEYTSGTGWGLTAAWPIATGKPFAGGHTVRLAVTGPPGTKVRITFNELGHDKQPVPGGIADGESWNTPVLAVQAEPLLFDLREAEVNAWYGNQQGNRRLDLDGLSSVGLQVLGGQGAGALTISAVQLQ